ncbi:unnamed protein product [Meganyctiphanes norvegica]|uniref:Secreted protein n=1 Tax=Meganyctiphanes norvegica TaxID=48144 RepID=A0AAV2RLF8_MEGNR
MRNFISISLLLLVAAGWAEGATCNCGAFLTTEFGDILIVSLPTTDVDSCDNPQKCIKNCQNELEGGDLFAISSDGERTNGQVACDAWQKPIHNQYIYGYYELCGGPWEYTGEHSQQMLCCDDNGQHQYCVA